MTDLDDALRADLDALDRRDLRRRLRRLDGRDGARAVLDSRSVLVFGSNDYLGLTGHPKVRAAAADAVEAWGAGATGSRLTTGDLAPHEALEAELAAFKGTEATLLFSSGFAANVGTIPALAGPGDLILSDALNHASLIDGCRLSRAEVRVYRHADADHARALLADRGAFRRVLLVTDGVFSMDGDIAPLPALVSVCEDAGAWLMVDDAHGTGVLGPTGRGVVEHFGLHGRVPIHMGTLSKSLGSAGGFVAGSHTLIEWLRQRARSFVFSTASAPATVAAARAALCVMQAEPERRARVHAHAARLRDGLGAMGFGVLPGETPIIPVMVGGAGEAMRLSAALEAQGVWAPAIRPPTVPPGTARLRVTVTAAHTDADIAEALKAFGRVRVPPPEEAPPPTPIMGSKSRGTGKTLDLGRGIFVTGTDTGVGKTVVAAALAGALRRRGIDAGVMKPFQTGTAMREGQPFAPDAEFLVTVAGVDDAMVLVCPVMLPSPLAPSVAAELAGRRVGVADVLPAFEELCRRHPFLVVEGAGGLAVPIRGRATMRDLAAALQLPVLIVARPGLGTINHTALTIEYARAGGLSVIGVVIANYPDAPDLAEQTNPEAMEALTGVPVLGLLPHDADVDTGTGRVGRIVESLAASSVLDRLLALLEGLQA